ncbi:MAG TPA: response regulator transcription factor [Nitrospira sp.]|nr:response regulator transcription factor [Nitrospira sp.]
MTREEIIRILLVDDVVLVRHTLRTILSPHPRFVIVGEAGDGEDALAWVPRCNPTVVVMDIQMPRLNGIQTTALIKRFFPHVIVVGLSVHATEDLRQEMIAAGASSVLTKDHAGARLHEEITKAVDYRSVMLS